MSIEDIEFVKVDNSVDAEEFKKMLEEHKAWINNAGGSSERPCGERLDLSNKIIRVLDMRGINLTGANLKGAVLRGVNLKDAVLVKADLSGADLIGANLLHADLRGANLTGADLIGANLVEADLTEATLNGASLRFADLLGADLRRAQLNKADLFSASLCRTFLLDTGLAEAKLYKANLNGACLTGASLRKADLSGADLRGANLRKADLTGADLSGAALHTARLGDADLTGADFTGTDLRGVALSDAVLENNIGLPALACPEKGSFTGWKYAFAFDMKNTVRGAVCTACDPVLVELSIPASAKRSSGAGRKCRCSKAKVKRIISMYTGEEVREAVSKWDKEFKYVVGETVEVKDFDENRWKECAPGIHFFMTQLEVFRFLFDPRPGEKMYNSFKRNGKIDKIIDYDEFY